MNTSEKQSRSGSPLPSSPLLGVGSDEYRKILEFNYGDDDTSKLMRDCWGITPWVANVCTRDREREISRWCHEQFGDEASFIHGIAGKWQRGHATVDGWTWMGFETEELMRLFESAFPSPNPPDGLRSTGGTDHG